MNIGIGEAARRLGVSAHTLRTWVRDQRVPHIRLGRRVLFDPAALDRFVAKRSVPVAGEEPPTPHEAA